MNGGGKLYFSSYVFSQKHGMLLFFLVLFLLTRRLGGEAELHIDELHITSRVSKLLLLS